MRAFITALVVAVILAPGAFAVGDQVIERRVAKLERRMAENYRRDRIVQNVLYMKDTGMYPQFLSMKIKINECLETKKGDDGTIYIVAAEFCAGVFGAQVR
jgi:hypothetical protein